MLKIFLIFFLLIFNHANAYIGPGMGGGLIATIIGFIFAIFVFLFGILWFPIKRFLKKKKKKKDK